MPRPAPAGSTRASQSGSQSLPIANRASTWPQSFEIHLDAGDKIDGWRLEAERLGIIAIEQVLNPGEDLLVADPPPSLSRLVSEDHVKSMISAVITNRAGHRIDIIAIADEKIAEASGHLVAGKEDFMTDVL